MVNGVNANVPCILLTIHILVLGFLPMDIQPKLGGVVNICHVFFIKLFRVMNNSELVN